MATVYIFYYVIIIRTLRLNLVENLTWIGQQKFPKVTGTICIKCKLPKYTLIQGFELTLAENAPVLVKTVIFIPHKICILAVF